MNRAEKVAEAQRLRAEGWKLREIADHFGVAVSTAGEYLYDPDLSDHRERDRRCRKTTGRGWCSQCGEPMGMNSKWQGVKRCRNCQIADFDRERNEKAAEVETLWAKGLSCDQIAEAMGYTPGSMRVQINRLRRMGYHLPYRRRTHPSGKPKFPEQVARD